MLDANRVSDQREPLATGDYKGGTWPQGQRLEIPLGREITEETFSTQTFLTTPALFWDPPGFDWIKVQKKQNSQKQILISKTKTEVLVTKWTGISPTYPIHNRTLLCVSP